MTAVAASPEDEFTDPFFDVDDLDDDEGEDCDGEQFSRWSDD